MGAADVWLGRRSWAARYAKEEPAWAGAEEKERWAFARAESAAACEGDKQAELDLDFGLSGGKRVSGGLRAEKRKEEGFYSFLFSNFFSKQF